jgi:hypothetical protein
MILSDTSRHGSLKKQTQNEQNSSEVLRPRSEPFDPVVQVPFVAFGQISLQSSALRCAQRHISLFRLHDILRLRNSY